MVRFANLWSIRFFHKYFKVQSYDGLTIVPFASTEKKFKSYGLLLKEINGTYMIFYKEERAQQSLLRTIDSPLKLVFYVFCGDNLLLNYSDLELADFNQCFFLDNSHPGQQGTTNLHPGLQLTNDQKVFTIDGFKDLDSYFQNDALMSVSTGRLNGDERERQEIFEGKYEDFKKQFAFEDVLQYGFLSVIRSKSDLPLNFYAVEQKKKKLFAILELTLNPGFSDKPLSYEVTIGARQVTWRYNVIEKEHATYSDFNIYAGKHLLKLKPVTKTLLGNGSQAFVLETSDPIVLSESYENYYEIEFSQTDMKAGKATSKKRVGLPIPDISRIKIFKNEDGFKAYSDMYVYL